MGTHNHQFNKSKAKKIEVEVVPIDPLQQITDALNLLRKVSGKPAVGSYEKQLHDEICKETDAIEKHCNNIQCLQEDYPKS